MMARVNKLAKQLPDMVQEFGYVKTANALTELYEQDVIALEDCEHLRYWLAVENMGWNDSLANELKGHKKIERESNDSVFSQEANAQYNRDRLENNQMTKWVDSPIFDQPQPQLELRSYGIA